MGPLSRHRRLVRERATAVLHDKQNLAAARLQFVASVQSTLAQPKVLLGFFAAGAGYGLIRGRNQGEESGSDEDEHDVSGAKLTGAAAALLAAARLLQQVMSAASFVGSLRAARESAPPAAAESEAVELGAVEPGRPVSASPTTAPPTAAPPS